MPAEWSRGCVAEEALAAEKTELEEVEAALRTELWNWEWLSMTLERLGELAKAYDLGATLIAGPERR